MTCLGSLEVSKALLELTGPKNPPATRLGAAKSVSSWAPSFAEQTEMEERMASLEQRLDGTSSGGRGDWQTNFPPISSY